MPKTTRSKPKPAATAASSPAATDPQPTSELVALVGECVMPWVFADRFVQEPAYREDTLALVREHIVGGFCMFGEQATQVAETVRHLQQEAATSHGTPLIFSCDCEFGLPMRLKEGGTEFPDMMAIGRTGDPALAAAVGTAIAQEMRALGLAWNFAPVADVNNNPHNPIINTRAFGDDPWTVIRYAQPLAAAMQQSGVAACAKHFPGHGDTTVDSHRALPVMTGGFDRFDTIELPPFRALVAGGIASVMTGHLAAPELALELGAEAGDAADRSATLSRVLTTGLLRESLQFSGIIVTDAMQMHAVSDRYGDGEGAVLAMLAGADLILMPFDARIAHAALLEAAQSGRIPREELEAHVERIRDLKARYDLSGAGADAEQLNALEAAHRELAREVATRAIERSGELPSEGLSGHALLVICDERPAVEEKAQRFLAAVRDRFASATLRTTSTWTAADLALASKTIVVTFHRARGYLSERSAAWTVPTIVRSIAEQLTTSPGTALAGLILLGDPYLDQPFTTHPTFVLKTYSESAVSIEVVTDILQHLA